MVSALNMSKALRYLRIAFSAFCVIACVLLIALWVRSYTHVVNRRINGHALGDHFKSLDSQNRLWQATSYRGAIILSMTHQDPAPIILSTNQASAPSPAGWHTANASPQLMGFGFLKEGQSLSARLPVWFPLLLCFSLAGVPWIFRFSWRFSLRTLLIATTLVAVALGFVVWAVR